MDEKIEFEYSLYRDGTPEHIKEIDDIDFVISTLVNLSILRPHKFELIFDLHRKYSERNGFREKFLEKALNQNSNFVNILIDKNIYCTNDIEHYYNTENQIGKLIDLSNEIAQIDIPESDICQSTFDLTECLIQTDYPPGTIEYCLKYDDINGIHRIYQDPSFFQDKANIIGVENIMNLDFNLLGFCGFFGSVHCFKFLLEKKLFIIGQLVIECVVCGGSIEVFRLCLQSIDISFFVSKLLILSSCYNNLDILHYLYDNVAGLFKIGVFEKTPLHYAAEKGHISIVEYLVDQKVDINAKYIDDWTPLHLAAANGHLSVVEYLVNHEADIVAKTKETKFDGLMILLFMKLLKKVILVLLNI